MSSLASYLQKLNKTLGGKLYIPKELRLTMELKMKQENVLESAWNEYHNKINIAHKSEHKQQTIDEDNLIRESGEVLQFGGKTPPIGGDDWLSKMEVGTVFYAQKKMDSDANLLTFRKASHEGKVVVLQTTQALPPNNIVPVDPGRFCNSWRCYQEVCVINNENSSQEGTGGADEHSDRTQSDANPLERPEGEPKVVGEVPKVEQ